MLNPTRILAARLRELERAEPGIPAPDPVHEMRVASRRLRAALRLLRLNELDPPVKKLQDALGDVRDLQLQIAWFEGRDAVLKGRHEPLLAKAERALESALRNWHEKALPRLLKALEKPPKLSARRTGKILRKRLRRLEQRLEAALEHPSPVAFHRVRISVKQVRYLFELTRRKFPKAAKLLLAELPPLQYAMRRDTRPRHPVRSASAQAGPRSRTEGRPRTPGENHPRPDEALGRPPDLSSRPPQARLISPASSNPSGNQSPNSLRMLGGVSAAT